MAIPTYIRTGDVLSNIIDSYTGEYITYSKVTTWIDGTPMTDAKCDPAIYRKLGTEYFKRNYTGPIQASWLNLDNTGGSDVSSIINQYITIDDLQLDDGIYSGIFTLTNNKLLGKKNTILKSNGGIDSVVVTASTQASVPSNITIDGNNISARGLVIGEASSVKEIKDLTIENIYGTNIQAIGIHINSSTTYKNINISRVIFNNIDALPNGSPADSAGAARGILISGNNITCTIDSCTFNNVGSFEDGDCITVDAGQDENTRWRDVNVIVQNCEFYDVKKRAVKVMASGVTIQNNKVFSSYSDNTNCPNNGFDLFGDNNNVLNNTIRYARATTGVRISGSYNQISGNDIIIDPQGLYTSGTALGTNTSAVQLIASTTSTIQPGFNVIRDNVKLQNSVYSLVAGSNNNTVIEDNKFIGRCLIDGGTTFMSFNFNSILHRISTSLKDHGLIIRGNTTTDFVGRNNFIDGYDFGISIGWTGTGYENITRWNIFDNRCINLRYYPVRYRATTFVGINMIGELVPDYGISGAILDSSSERTPDNQRPGEIAVYSAALSGSPTLTGVGFWRIECQKIWPSVANEWKEQTATAVNNSSILQANSSIKLRRIYDPTTSTWTAWVRIMTYLDLTKQLEITDTQISFPTAFLRYKTISVDTTFTLDSGSLSQGGHCSVLLTNSANNPITVTLNTMVLPDGLNNFSIPAESSLVLNIKRINGVTKGFIEQ